MFYLISAFVMISGVLIKWVKRPAIQTTEHWKGHTALQHTPIIYCLTLHTLKMITFPSQRQKTNCYAWGHHAQRNSDLVSLKVDNAMLSE